MDLAIFSMVTLEQSNKQTNNQPGDPRASLLLTSEKAVCCNIQYPCTYPLIVLHQAAWWDGIRGPGVPESSMTVLPAWTRNWTTGGKKNNFWTFSFYQDDSIGGLVVWNRCIVFNSFSATPGDGGAWALTGWPLCTWPWWSPPPWSSSISSSTSYCQISQHSVRQIKVGKKRHLIKELLFSFPWK